MKRLLALLAVLALASCSGKKLNADVADQASNAPQASEAAPSVPADMMAAGEAPKEPVAPNAAAEPEKVPEPSLGPPTPAPSLAKAEKNLDEMAKPEEPGKTPMEQYLEKRAKAEEKERKQQERELVYHEAGRYHVSIDYVFKAFADYDFDQSTVTRKNASKGGQISFLYFPLNHTYGRFGLGVSLGGYFAKNAAPLSGLSPSFFTYGVKSMYEFDYWVGQLFVPFAIFGYDRVELPSYILSGVTVSGDHFDNIYYGGGLAFNLNRLEPRVASKSLADTGIKKFYLVYTLQQRSNADSGKAGLSHLAGLRFEF